MYRLLRNYLADGLWSARAADYPSTAVGISVLKRCLVFPDIFVVTWPPKDKNRLYPVGPFNGLLSRYYVMFE